MDVKPYSEDLDALKIEILEQVRRALDNRVNRFYEQSEMTFKELAIMFAHESATPLKRFFDEGTARNLYEAIKEQWKMHAVEITEYEAAYIFAAHMQATKMEDWRDADEIIAFINDNKNARSQLERIYLYLQLKARLEIKPAARFSFRFGKKTFVPR